MSARFGPGERIPVSAGAGNRTWVPRLGIVYLAADQRLTSVPVTFTAQGALILGSQSHYLGRV
jgi:hypothetical protein